VPNYASDRKIWRLATTSHWDYLYKGGGRMLIQDEPSTSRDAKILQIRGCFYGKIKYAMPVSGRSYPKNDKLWNTISKISEIASTIYEFSTLADRAFWRFIILDVYKLDERVRNQGARNNFDADVEALTLC
jgi:hypothetical protein